MEFKFQPGSPACPVACKYCHVTELDLDRSNNWSKGMIGINKACTFINVPPWINDDKVSQNKFDHIPYHLLDGDWVGWTAITDGLMPQLRPYFWKWVEQTSSRAKLLTVVTKWPINRQLMKELAIIPNFYLVVTITGNPYPIELVNTKVHLRTLQYAQEYGVKALPMCHPYISGVSDLSFLGELYKLGYNQISIKGLRYNPITMASWMPESSQVLYNNTNLEEVLPDDGWETKVSQSGFTLLSPKQWYNQNTNLLFPKLSWDQASDQVNSLIPYTQIASSASSDEVIEAAIRRRM